jgi:exosome complex component RRP42
MAAQRQASSASQTPHISPAELSYLYNSLSLPGSPIRPDGRSATQFRPLTAEPDILPGTNGSARVGFADGTQAIVGVKAEVEKTVVSADALKLPQQAQDDYTGNENGDGNQGSNSGHGSWVQMSIEIPGFRDDDALPVFMSEMMREPLVESVSNGGSGNGEMAGGLKGRLVINRRWHWRLYIDVNFLINQLAKGVGRLILLNLGSSPLSAPVISASAAIPNDSSGASVDEAPEIEITRRGRSVFRRRLGCSRIPLSTL